MADHAATRPEACREMNIEAVDLVLSSYRWEVKVIFSTTVKSTPPKRSALVKEIQTVDSLVTPINCGVVEGGMKG